MPIGKIKAIKDYFSTPDKPVTTMELTELRRDNIPGFDELAEGAAKELGEELTVTTI